MKKKKLFPEYLNVGSTGLAVNALILTLIGTKYDPNKELVPDGIYGEKLAECVKRVQKDGRIDQDGHCGPDSRRVLREELGVDLNEIDWHANTMYKAPGSEKSNPHNF